MPIVASANLPTTTRGKFMKRKADALPSEPSRSTLWRRAHGKPSRLDKAAKQQYLTPAEENAPLDYVLRMSERGYPLLVKFLRSLALVIARQRSSVFRTTAVDNGIRPPGKNWPQGFYKRHPELKARRVKALDWARHDHNIHDKVMHWFSIIGKELHDPAIVPENVYNMDETGVLLSVLSSLKVLVSRQDLRNCRGAGVQRTLITAIECISADGRCLDPLIIWPTSTHRSTWTTHPTPGWHFACSKTGYTDTQISLYWMQHVFDPLTRPRANHKPRILISDGFGTHHSLELMKFCFESNIILCQLPSHTSHKLQPCDVGAFGPLKTAYREQVEQLYRGGANMVGKQHFTLLYSRARNLAFTSRNIKSGWSQAGLYPFKPDRILSEIQQPPAEAIVSQTANVTADLISHNDMLRTPVTYESLTDIRTMIERGTVLDSPSKHRFQKLANAAEKAFADRAILLDENKLLFEQNNEKTTRSSTRSTVTGTAKIMTYEDIMEAQKKRDIKEAATAAKTAGRKRRTAGLGGRQWSRTEELEHGRREIRAFGLEEYCSVLQF
jgi:DDE superfamily endonuclease